jgi:hypothetical protein
MVLLFSPALALRGQTLRGVVYELGTDRPVASAVVAIVDSDGQTLISTTTDREGRFSLSFAQPGEYSVYAEGLGYFASVDGPLDLSADDSTEVAFHLERNPISLDAIDVSASPRARGLALTGFYDRKKLNRGHFIERLEIDERNPQQMTDLFRSGVSFRVISHQSAGNTGGYTLVSRRYVTFQNVGYCGPMVYVDGIRAGRTYGGPYSTPLDQLIHPDEVEAIEAYSGLAEVPEQWRDSAASCGVILIWTRRSP